VLGDWAYLWNSIEMTMTREGEPPVHRSGYTLTILRKQPDGRWLLTWESRDLVQARRMYRIRRSQPISARQM
jgi:ketosteroid isomerase-like protein